MSFVARATLLGGFVLLSAVYLIWGWSDELSEFGGDSSGYILAARYFSPFHPLTPLLRAYGHQIFYPPLFPILIGLLGGSLLAGHLLVIASLLGAVFCFYLWLHRTGVAWTSSACTALVFALMPATYLQALNIWTENTYLFFCLLAFYVVERAENNKQSETRLWWWAATAVAAGTLVRVAGLPLLVAFALRVALLRPRRWPGIVAASAAPFFLWAGWSRVEQVGVEGYTSQWATLYGDHWLKVLLAQLQQESFAIVTAWSQSWLDQTTSGFLFYAILIFGIWCLLGWVRRLIKGKIDAFYVLVYGLLLLAWPHPEEVVRYSYALFPVLLGQGVWFLHQFAKGQPKSLARLAQAIVLSILIIATLPTLLLTIKRFIQPIPVDQAAARRTEGYYLEDPRKSAQQNDAFVKTLALFHHLDDFVPEGECIFSAKPNVVELYANRMSYMPPAPSLSDAAFEQEISKCRYAYLWEFITPTFKESFYPIKRLGRRAQPLYVVSDRNGDQVKALGMLVEIVAPND
jgi:hypothetical protein